MQSIEAHRTKGGVKDKVRTTNLESNNFAEKGKGKVSNWKDAPLKDWSRNLFAEEFSTNKSTDSVLYDEDWVRQFPMCKLILIFVNEFFPMNIYMLLKLYFFCLCRGD